MRMLLEDHQVELIYSRDISHEGLLKNVQVKNSEVPHIWNLLVKKLPYDIFGGEIGIKQDIEVKTGDGIREPHFLIKTKNKDRTVFYVINTFDPPKKEESMMVEALRTARKLNKFYDRCDAEFGEDSAGFAIVIAKKKSLLR